LERIVSKSGIWFSLSFVAWLATTHPAMSDETAVSVYGLAPELYEQFSLTPNTTASQVVLELQHSLEQAGYVLADVRLYADNKVGVTLGQVREIQINGLGERSAARARSYLEPLIESGKNRLDQFDHALSLVDDLPGITASMAFERMENPGEYRLVINASEQKHAGAVWLDSTPRNLFDQNRITLQEDVHNIFTGGDIFRFQGMYMSGGGEPDADSIYLSYQAPVGTEGTYAEFSIADYETETQMRGRSTSVISNTGFTIVPGAVTNHDFEGQAASLTVGYPVLRNHDHSKYIVAEIDYNDDKTTSVGDTETWAGDLTWFQDYHSPDGSSLAFGVSLGGGYTDSYIDSDDGNFHHLQAGVGYIHPLTDWSPTSELRFEMYGQLSSNDTPNSKLFGLGGTDFLRGYDSSALMGNSGLAGTVELAKGYYFTDETVAYAAPYVFLDFGAVKNPSDRSNASNRPDDGELASIGFGTRIGLRNAVSLEGYVAQPLMDDHNGDTPSATAYLKATWSW
jgi:hemolysin activation/secretion protein